MSEVNDLVLVNALMRQALVAIEEVMGQKGLHAVLRTSKLDHYIDHLPPDDLSPAIQAADYARLNEAIEAFYGRGGRGMLQRVGKASFEYAIRNQSALFGLAGVALKMLPTQARIRFVLTRMAGAVKKANPQLLVDVEETDTGLAYVARVCSLCYGRHSDKPVCHLYVGSITEGVRWATGQVYQVQETHCLAKGDPYCRFTVTEPKA